MAELLVEFGSPDKEIVAVFAKVVAEAGAVTVMAIDADAPIGMGVVREQEIVAVPEQDHPGEDVTETNVTPVGNVSVRTFEVTGALICPRFCT